ncbi:MAG: FtsH protease activity modulator HflK [Deltaproteobacteria bacterium]|nr:FtsH protease activity modulator HflK [Deltaproteobacteria bacterium]
MGLDRKSSAAFISIGVNVLLVLLKLLLAILSGSLALLADALHSGSDILVSVLVFLGIRVSQKRAIPSLLRSRIENSIAITISVVIWYSAYVVFRRALGQGTTEIRMLPVALAGTAISIMVSYFLSRYKIHVGRSTNSPSLIADGEHSRTDMYSSIAVLIGLIGYMMGFRLDPVAAIVVGFLITVVGFEIFQSGARALLTKTSLQFIALRLRIIPFLRRTGLVGYYRKIVPYRRMIIWVATICLVVSYLLTGLYTVRPGEEAIVLRFGRIIKPGVMPGIHYRFPFPFEKVIRLGTGRINRVEIGFRTRKTFEEEPEAYLWETRHVKGKYEKHYDEALMLTGDQNIVDVWMVVQYRIRNMVDYLFRVDAPETLIKGACEAAVRYLVARQDIDMLLTSRRHWIEQEIERTLQGFLDRYGVGVEIINVAVPAIHPPIEVVPAFRSVASASEDKERYIREAESYFNRIVPRARADAARTLEEAKAYEIAKVNRAEGEAMRFLEQLGQYRAAKDISTTRIYLETMEKVLPGTNKFILIPGGSTDVLDLRPYAGRRGSVGGLIGGRKE